MATAHARLEQKERSIGKQSLGSGRVSGLGLGQGRANINFFFKKSLDRQRIKCWPRQTEEGKP